MDPADLRPIFVVLAILTLVPVVMVLYIGKVQPSWLPQAVVSKVRLTATTKLCSALGSFIGLYSVASAIILGL